MFLDVLIKASVCCACVSLDDKVCSMLSINKYESTTNLANMMYIRRYARKVPVLVILVI